MVIKFRVKGTGKDISFTGDYMVVGDSPELILNHKWFRNRLISAAADASGASPAVAKKLVAENAEIIVEECQLKDILGFTAENAGWGCTLHPGKYSFVGIFE